MKRKNFLKTEIIRTPRKVRRGQLVQFTHWLHKVLIPLPFGYAIVARQPWRAA